MVMNDDRRAEINVLGGIWNIGPEQAKQSTSLSNEGAVLSWSGKPHGRMDQRGRTDHEHTEHWEGRGSARVQEIGGLM